MKISDIKKEFEEGKINKWQYIDKMYENHSVLFDYSEFLQKTNISEIKIEDERVIMNFRDSGIQFICTKNDKRLAPLDTLNFGNYEHEELQMQINLIKPEFTIFDVGANYGWYALHIAKKVPKAKIYSFEPIPTTFKFLNENIELNEIKNIETLNFGFSDSIGTFDFFFNPELSVNASLANVSGNEKNISVQCKVKKMDSFSEKKKLRVDFIKCDVEGAELLVFRGGIKTIEKYKPIIFTEMLRKWTSKFNYSPNDIISFFNALNYLCFTISNGKLKPFGQMDENTTQTNFFFLHTHKHSEQIKFFSV